MYIIIHVLFSILNELLASIADQVGVKQLDLTSCQKQLNQPKCIKQWFSDIGHQAS